ncbi:unnamed protein product [Rotaria sordida]|uniref:G-protein coupled receptors family 1 profile domain-containing protein n=1 Tax=Rotaria sordida TaxID=392033 RepID=A0A813NVC3_9BILA|nr:unnamed protein product [Rotaria sordida]CAF0744271.1 unnamed protein product [Rotaria sordida]CAF0758482.1 unnamed protein product [Rotaria sordida]CAF0796719.1 unnamed protein product [Rotaria sordida]CAF3666940.1 unnamed protein product [Rotaria sordida]
MMNNNFTMNNDDIHHTEQMLSIIHLRFFLVRIFYPCLLVWGTIGNALCLRVLLSKKFFKNSTCQYLAVLAVIDILFIFMRSSKHVYKLFRDTPIFNTSKWICRILTFFSSALAHMGSWILVIVSFDRYFIVTSGYRRHSSPVNRVFCSTSILFAIVVLCNLYYFFILGRETKLDYYGSTSQPYYSLNDTMDINNNKSLEMMNVNGLFQSKVISIFVCIPSNGYERFFRTYIPIFDILLVAVIPFFLLCFSNIGIILYTMRKSRHMHQHRKRAHRRHQRLTIMLLSVTLAFIGLTCPSVIFICANKIIQSNRMKRDEKTDNINQLFGRGQPSNVPLIVEACEALWYTKHAMNFILYTLSGQDFRREFIKLFTQCFHNRPAILKKLIRQTPMTTQQTIDSTLIEIPIITDTSYRKKKHTNNNNEIIV